MGGLITSALEGRKDFDLMKAGFPCVEAFFASLADDRAASVTKIPAPKSRRAA